jgi:general transcription factor 3C polypeptide 2
VPMFTQLNQTPAASSSTTAETSAPPPAAASTPSPAPAKRRGRPPKSPATPGAGTLKFEPVKPEDTPISPEPAVPKRRGRPPKNPKPEVPPSAAEGDDVDLPPSKRRKLGEETEQGDDGTANGGDDAMVVDDDDDDDDDAPRKPKGKKAGTPKKAGAAPSAAPKKAPVKRKKKKSDSDEEVVLSAEDDDDDSLPDDAAADDDDDDVVPGDDDDDGETKKRKRGAPSRAPPVEVFYAATKAELEKLTRKLAEDEDLFLFPRWLPTRNDIRIIQDGADEYLPVNAQSRPFAFRNGGATAAAAPEDPKILQRFDVHLRKTTNKDSEFDDLMVHTGGPIWGLDWCPMSSIDATRQFLAISSHKQDDDLHVYGTIYEAKNIVQVRWLEQEANALC